MEDPKNEAPVADAPLGTLENDQKPPGDTPPRVQSEEEIAATERALANADAPLVKAEKPKRERKPKATKPHRLAAAEPVSQPGETAPRLAGAEPAQQPVRKRRRRRGGVAI